MLRNIPEGKGIKRPLYFDIFYAAGQPFEKDLFEITYIIDYGNLIQDVQQKHTEIVRYKDWDKADAARQRVGKSFAKVQSNLEFQLRRNGATDYTAKMTAKKLLQRYSYNTVER